MPRKSGKSVAHLHTPEIRAKAARARKRAFAARRKAKAQAPELISKKGRKVNKARHTGPKTNHLRLTPEFSRDLSLSDIRMRPDMMGQVPVRVETHQGKVQLATARLLIHQAATLLNSLE